MKEANLLYLHPYLYFFKTMKTSLLQRILLRLKAAWYGHSTLWNGAIHQENGSMAEALLDAGVKTDEVILALFDSLKGDGRVLRALLKAGVNPNHRHDNNLFDYFIHRAIRQRRLDLVKILIEADADIETRDGNKYTALAAAVDKSFFHVTGRKKERLEIIRLLLEKGADPNTKGDDERTPLHYASTDEIKMLIQYGADPNLCDKDGNPAFHRGKNISTRDELSLWLDACVSKRTPIDLKNRRGQTLLAVFLESSSITSKESVKVLEEMKARGARLDTLDNEGNTLLHIIAKTKTFIHHKETIDWLLNEHGEWFCQQKNKEGMTAEDIIQKRLKEESFFFGSDKTLHESLMRIQSMTSRYRLNRVVEDKPEASTKKRNRL